jgi:type IV secretion system protein VirB3
MSDGSDFYDPFYKGCTVPSTAFGIPMLPFILVTLIFAQLGILAFFTGGAAPFIVLVLLYLALFLWAKRVSRHDEQRLLQLWLRARIRLQQRNAKALWGAISFGPGARPTKRRR